MRKKKYNKRKRSDYVTDTLPHPDSDIVLPIVDPGPLIAPVPDPQVNIVLLDPDSCQNSDLNPETSTDTNGVIYVAEGDGDTKKKLRNKDYDFFCEKTSFNNIVKCPILADIMRRHIINLNEKIFLSYYLFCIYIYESTSNYNYKLNLYSSPSKDRSDAVVINPLQIDKVTIQRCANLISNGIGKFRHEDAETNCLRDVFSKYKHLFPIKDIDSDNQPIEKFSEQMFTSICNHYTINFDRCQFVFLKQKLEFHLTIYLGMNIRYPANLHNYLTRRCQSAINSNTKVQIELDTERPENKQIDQVQLNKILDIFVRDEVMRIPLVFGGHLLATTEAKKEIRNELIKSNLFFAISYFRYMLDFLEIRNVYRFDLLPQMNLGLHCINFGCRFLSIVIINGKRKYIK